MSTTEYKHPYDVPRHYAKLSSVMKKFTSTLMSFKTAFQPLIEKIDKKEEALRKYAGAVTMDRVRGMFLRMVLGTIDNANSNASIQTYQLQLLTHSM